MSWRASVGESLATWSFISAKIINTFINVFIIFDFRRLQGSCPLASSSLNRFRNSPDHGRLLTAYLDLLLRCDVGSAKTFAKECIIGGGAAEALIITANKAVNTAIGCTITTLTTLGWWWSGARSDGESAWGIDANDDGSSNAYCRY